jgi:uncharacterized protein
VRRRLSEQDVEAIAQGSAILGTGGGGDPYLGTVFVAHAVREFGEPELISVDELDDDALVVQSVMVGSPVPFMEKLSLGPELPRAFAGMQAAVQRPITALMTPEIGGVNTVIAIALAAELGLPVVDADGMGRAFPEVQLVTYSLYGINVCPLVMADEHGNVVTINAVDNDWTEKLARSTVIQFGAISPTVGFPMSKAELEQAAVLGSVSTSLEIGQALLDPASAGPDALERVLAITGGAQLFEGKVTAVDRRVTGGWAGGDVEVEGSGPDRGSHLRVTFQNENLVAFQNEEIVASVPDLITIVEQDTGRAITTERLRYGVRVRVLAMPADDRWVSEPGLEMAGPRHFGYDADYRPFAGRRPANPVTF